MYLKGILKSVLFIYTLLIDWIVFSAVSVIFPPFSGGIHVTWMYNRKSEIMLDITNFVERIWLFLNGIFVVSKILVVTLTSYIVLTREFTISTLSLINKWSVIAYLQQMNLHKKWTSYQTNKEHTNTQIHNMQMHSYLFSEITTDCKRSK